MKKLIGPGLLLVGVVLVGIACLRRLAAHYQFTELAFANKPESVVEAAETKALIEFYLTGAPGLLFLVTGIVVTAVMIAARSRHRRVSTGTTADDVYFEIHYRGSPPWGENEAGLFRCRNAGFAVEIRDATLRVNGASYGCVRKGQKLRVTNTGQVFVDEVERRPE
jgi:hypothetical protein